MLIGDPVRVRAVRGYHLILRRIIRNATCLLSALLFLAGMALWVHSQASTADFERFSRRTDFTQHPPQTHTLAFGIGWGNSTFGVFFSRGQSGVPSEEARTWLYREFGPVRQLLSAPSVDDRLNWRWGRFQVLHQVQPRPDGWLSVSLVVVPMWVFCLFAIPPLALLWRMNKPCHTAPKAA
jgi:hypothetical protein